MSETVLVVAPHADDETLGCGGALLRHIEKGDQVHWLLVTELPSDIKVSGTSASDRESEIVELGNFLGLHETHRLGYLTTTLDQIAVGDLVSNFSNVISKVNPSIVYLPFPGDAHSDHGVVFQAVSACTKWFRYPGIKSVRVYETLSETNFSINPIQSPFRPNLYIDITPYFDKKIQALSIYKNEMGNHPFPRSDESVKALSTLRGSEMGVEMAEAFMIIKQIEK